MNTLSWLIYAAELLGRMQVLLWISASATGCYIFAGYSSKLGRAPHPFYALANGHHRGLLAVCVTLIVAAVFVPSERTIYLIAASEAGETVVTSPDAIEMMGDLKQIIKKRLKEELGATE